ncbi:MAG: polyprenyl synthetase family protein [Pseudomonadota bacterium]|nr:polyprenyl synthetase family protein [Pseudomonadota bacterium]
MSALPTLPWFHPLVEPVRHRVDAAWRWLPPDSIPREMHPDSSPGDSDGARGPRAGFGGAVVIHVARGWGTRRWQEAGRVGVALVEACNQQVFRGAPDPAARTWWLTTDLRRAHAVCRAAVRRDEALLRRVVDRVLGAPNLGAEPVPEAVVFLRAAVAAGVLAGAVPDSVHSALDRWATALGLAMEHTEAGTPGPARADALEEAARALAGLPDCDAKERLAAVLVPGPTALGLPRAFHGWAPFALPTEPMRERAPLEQALIAPFPGDGPLPRAATWLAAHGGKRLRARIALAAARAVGGPEGSALPVAVAAEWAHTASLVLDDIVDEAELRRGAPALHRVTSVPFAAGVAGWLLARTLLSASEDAAAVGTDASGAAPTLSPPTLSPPTRAALGDTLLALAEGQRAELACAGKLTMGLDEWYEIASAKTARLFAFAATNGGAAAGGTRRQQKALGRYGQELGLAFQIVDDVLDYVGEEAALGKRPGQDQRAGRVTFPLLLLRELDPGALDHAPDAVLAALHAHGIAGLCRARAQTHLERAVAALAGLPGDTSELIALATRCVERRA